MIRLKVLLPLAFALLLLGGWFFFREIMVDDEAEIRAKLIETSSLLTKEPNPAPLAALEDAGKLKDCFTKNLDIGFYLYGKHGIYPRAELIREYFAFRRNVQRLIVDFYIRQITVSEDVGQARIRADVSFRYAGAHHNDTYYTAVTLKKEDGEWRIAHITEDK